MKTITSILIGLACLSVDAATTNCPNANLSTVQNAVNGMNDGDTVNVPAGSVTWASTLSITKHLSVIGAGTNSTIVTCNGQAVQIQLSGSGIVRVSGIKFLGPSDNSDCMHIWCATNSRARIDHCWIQNFNGSSPGGGFAFYNGCAGVVDHCTVVDCNRFARTISPTSSTSESSTPVEEWWVRTNTAWFPPDFASTNSMVYESNVGIWNTFDSSGSGPNIMFSAQDGGGYVVRHSSFNVNITVNSSAPQFFECHGNQGVPSNPATPRGTYVLNIYSNTFTCTGLSSGVQFITARAGSGLLFSNIVTGTASSLGIYFHEEDIDPTSSWFTGTIYDPITNYWIWGNVCNGTTYDGIPQPGYNTDAYMGNGVYFSNLVPAQVVTLVYPHPLVTAQDPPLPTKITARNLKISNVKIP